MAFAVLDVKRLKHWVFLWPLALAILVLFRQQHEFRLRIDDIPHQKIAQKAAALTRDGWHQSGLPGAFGGFIEGTSMKGELPAHINPNRPLIVWLWSAAYTLAGEQGLQWTWRVLYVMTIIGLFLLLSRLSFPESGAFLAAAVAVAPVTQGLLSWMSASTYFITYSLLLYGTFAIIAGTKLWHRGLGVGLLFVSLFSRDVTYLLLPTAVAFLLLVYGQKRVAVLVVILTIVRWLCFQSETTTSLATLTQDFPLFIRSSLVVVAAESASLVRNVGLVLLVPLLLILLHKRWIGLCLAIVSLVVVHTHITLLWILLLVSCFRSRRAVPGALWALISVGSMCLYGHFASRYAFEPLVGFSLALGPVLPKPRSSTRLLVLPLLIWHTLACLTPDLLHRSRLVTRVTEFVDQRHRALDFVVQRRLHDRRTFADRIEEPWNLRQDMSLLVPGSRYSAGRVWQAGSFWIAGNTANLHCGSPDLLLFNRHRLWEWNTWYWRVVPPEKGGGARIMTKDERWSVFAGARRGGRNTLWIVDTPIPTADMEERVAITAWLADIPELMQEQPARQWLEEVWDHESGCSISLAQSSFRELELGRLFLRDDGWLDLGELLYLKNHARSKPLREDL